MKEKGIDDEPCPTTIFGNHVLSDNGQGQDTALVAVSVLNPKGQLSEELAQELAVDREESSWQTERRARWTC